MIDKEKLRLQLLDPLRTYRKLQKDPKDSDLKQEYAQLLKAVGLSEEQFELVLFGYEEGYTAGNLVGYEEGYEAGYPGYEETW